MAILITGASGFIGKNLLSHLLKTTDDVIVTISKSDRLQSLSYRHSCINCDLSDNYSSKVLKYINDHHEIDTIYHLAGHANATPDNGLNIISTNVLPVVNILNNVKFNRLIFTSTTKVYGRGGVDETSDRHPKDDYSLSKYLAEETIVKKVPPEKFNIFRLGPVVGQGATHGIVRDLQKKILTDKVINLIGKPPGSYRSYIHIDDVISIITNKESWKAKFLNVCGSEMLSNLDVVSLMMEILGSHKEVSFSMESWAGDITSLDIDNSLLTDYVGFTPMKSTEAIKKYF